mgnify:CR=1 FL=1
MTWRNSIMQNRLQMICTSVLIALLQSALLTFTGCSEERPARVEIKKKKKGYDLYLNDKPFYIKGAVAWNRFDLIEKYGGNAARSGSRPELLDKAAKYDLVCLVNLPVKAERDGMNYDDSSAVREQFDRVIAFVQDYKHHPAVMMWALGNELDWIPPGEPYNRKVWSHLNDLAVKIHEIDPLHPVLTTIGSVHEKVIQELNASAPQLDLIGLNEYGNILKLSGWIRDFGWKKPYVLTEWGPSGFWQVPYTGWDAPVEETSTMKAELYQKRYEQAILEDEELCLGSFVFLWNQHQERTHTWFGMFDAQWRETEAVNVMRYEWTGEWPENRAPAIDSVLLAGRTAYSSICLRKGQTCSAEVFVSDPDHDPLQYNWEILKEGTEFPYGGQGEERPPAVSGLIKNPAQAEIQLNAPAESGAYRVFVYIYDDHNHFATANIPFYVKGN